MTHPRHETLADYTDGALDPAQHEAVKAHLHGCADCREQVALASSARDALGSLEEAEMPVGVAGPVLREAGISHPQTPAATSPPSRARVPRAYRLLAAAAAALVIVGGTWAAVRTLGGGGGSPGAATAGAAAPGVPAEDIRKLDDLATKEALELDSARTGYLAAGAGDRSEVSQEAHDTPGASATPSTVPRSVGGNAFNSTKAAHGVQRCLDEADAMRRGGTLLDVVKDTYAGEDAFYVVLSEGPTPTAEHDRVTVWVFAREGCRILAFTTKYYPSMRPSPPTAIPSP